MACILTLVHLLAFVIHHFASWGRLVLAGPWRVVALFARWRHSMSRESYSYRRGWWARRQAGQPPRATCPSSPQHDTYKHNPTQWLFTHVNKSIDFMVVIMRDTPNTMWLAYLQQFIRNIIQAMLTWGYKRRYTINNCVCVGGGTRQFTGGLQQRQQGVGNTRVTVLCIALTRLLMPLSKW